MSLPPLIECMLDQLRIGHVQPSPKNGHPLKRRIALVKIDAQMLLPCPLLVAFSNTYPSDVPALTVNAGD